MPAFALVQAAVAGAQAPVVSAADTVPREATPGSPLTAVFRIAAANPARMVYQGLVRLPPGWRLLSGSGPVVLEPRVSQTRLALVAVPPPARAGAYTVEYQLTAERDTSIVVARAWIVVRVTAQPRLEVMLLDAPDYAAAGSEYEASFLVKNRGNVDAHVVTRAASTPGFPVQVEQVGQLRAGESRSVRASVMTRETGRSSTTALLEVSARIAGADSVTARAQAVVLLVGRAGGDRATTHHVPLRVRMIAGGQPDTGSFRPAMAIELTGGGLLFEGGATRVDVLARRSRTTPLPFGLRDEYSVGVTSTKYDLRLGAQSFALSPLLRQEMFGSGASGRLSLGALTVGGFRRDDRWAAAHGSLPRATPVTENAAFAELRPARSLTVGMNVLSTTVAGGDLRTASARLTPHPFAWLEVESGAGAGAGRGTRGSMARASGASRFVGYDVRRLHTDTGFAGTQAGLSEGYARVTLSAGGVQLSGATQHQHRTPRAADSTAREVRAREETAELGIGGRMWLAYRAMEQNIGLPGSGGRQETLRLRFRARTGSLAWLGEGERGVLLDSAGTHHPLATAVLRSAFQTRNGQSISTFVERTLGRPRFVSADQDRWSAGINTTLRSRSGLWLDLFLTGVRDRAGDAVQRSSMLDGAVGYATAAGASAALRWRLTEQGGAAPPRQENQLTITVPLGVPVRQMRSTARVVGRVYDIETGRGVPNALVLLGDRAAITDRHGRLAFQAVRPDTYQVQLDLGGAAALRVPLAGAEQPITAAGGRTTRVELGVGRSSRITGRVRRHAPVDVVRWTGEASQLVDAGGMGGVIVTATNGERTVRRATDAEGSFTFSDLPPGAWILKLTADEVPAHHHFSPDVSELRLEAGESATADFRLLPVKRTLRIVGGGEVAVVARAPAGEPEPGVKQPPVAARKPVVAELPVTTEEEDRPRYYTTEARDTTVRAVAARVYRDVSLWPKIWAANRDIVTRTGRIPAGTRLFIPTKAPLTPEESAAVLNLPVLRPRP